MLHRVDGPAIEQVSGEQEWYQDGVRHRIDGPAVTNSDGSWSWYLHGKKHRTDGPAVRLKSGELQWWLNGRQTTEPDSNVFADRVHNLSRDDLVKFVHTYGFGLI